MFLFRTLAVPGSEGQEFESLMIFRTYIIFIYGGIWYHPPNICQPDVNFYSICKKPFLCSEITSD